MRSSGLRDVAMTAMSSVYGANSMWQEGVAMSFTYRLNSAGETSPPWDTPTRMPHAARGYPLGDTREHVAEEKRQ
jgi:hypothetical protein